MSKRHLKSLVNLTWFQLQKNKTMSIPCLLILNNNLNPQHNKTCLEAIQVEEVITEMNNLLAMLTGTHLFNLLLTSSSKISSNFQKTNWNIIVKIFSSNWHSCEQISSKIIHKLRHKIEQAAMEFIILQIIDWFYALSFKINLWFISNY